eukprot:CAMPEP_0178926010 /NCGR_PEP_ID=MMETSP0786-20121207/18262_1 /TAXON_ID=186022 /ORGANISM="Thalassionema frauenfeldii, Strain CCMP 1798" /LENGTH=288 /DNA_ID=CAMNT_0020601019 /DNA_START=430 /DNA_END=1293 /DNA_ORIENTATION=-
MTKIRVVRKQKSTSDKDALLFNNLGNAHFCKGNFEEALNAYYLGLEIERVKLEPTHPNIIVTLSNISETYRQRGDMEVAVQTYMEVLLLQLERFGVFHPETAKTLHVIGLIYDQMGNLQYALGCLKYVIALQRDFKCGESQNLSASLTHAGCIFYRLNRINTAMEYLYEALQLEIKREDTQELPFILYNLGLCYQAEGSYNSAIKCYTKSLELEIKTLGKDHKDSSATNFKLGEVFSVIGRFEKALSYFQNALRIGRKQVNEKMDSNTEIRILIEIGYIYCYQGNVSC